MSRTCTACSHTLRLKIDKAIALGKSNRAIASKFGLTRSAVHRHKPHVAEAIERAAEKRKLSIGENVLDVFENLKRRSLKLLDSAEREKNHTACIGYLREIRGIVGALYQVTTKEAELGRVEVPHPSPCPNCEFEEFQAALSNEYIGAINNALGCTGKLIPIGTPPSQAEENGSDGESTIDILPD